MKAVTVIRSDDGSLSISHTTGLAPHELVDLMHEGMEALARTRYAYDDSFAEHIRRHVNE